MELNNKQQIVELVKTSNNILLVSHVNPDGDAIGSLIALYLVFKKMGKNVTAAVSTEISSIFDFLPKIETITHDFSGIKDFIISLDLTNVSIEKLGYKKDLINNKLNIVVAPKSGNFSPEDVSFSYGANKFDLIFVLDCPDLDRLGTLYDENTDLFYETPIINIDHHPGNDNFGKVNLIDLTATSTSEILVSLIESFSREKQLLDSDIATCLLTGITTDTGSFQNTNTTPKSLTVAAQMVAAGARQQEIVQKIYKTKKLSTLKLWGAILSKIKKETTNFVWSYVTEKDFIQTKSATNETQGVIDELLKTVPEIDFALLLVEKNGSLHGSFRSTKININVSEIAKIFGGGGHEQAAAFELTKTNYSESGAMIINKINEILSNKKEENKHINSDDQSNQYELEIPEELK